MRTFTSISDFAGAVGEDLGTSPWVTITQERIDQFAEATGDHQWIHVDPQRAADGPFGTTIAHGFLTLSLVPSMLWQIYAVEGTRMAVNYGADTVRFVSPVPVGSRVRGQATLAEATPSSNGGTRFGIDVTIELDGSDRPACVLRTIAVMYP